MANSYYGKYRARVVDVSDPENRGRIRVQCPAVTGESKSTWCEPCVPVAYDGGGDFYVPKVGDTVWVEFEEGKASKPIWVGGWWSSGKTSSADCSPDTRVIEFDGCKIEMNKSFFRVTVGDSVFEVGPESSKMSSGNASMSLSNGKIMLN